MVAPHGILLCSTLGRVPRQPGGRGSDPCPPGCRCGRHSRSPAYSTRHGWVRKARGNASEHTCVECRGQARDWAQLHGTTGLSPADYQSMCRRCHFIYDDVSGSSRGQPSPFRGVPLPANQGHSYNSKITEQDIPVIRELLREGGLSLRAIARRYGVGHAAIAAIRDGRHWDWVPRLD